MEIYLILLKWMLCIFLFEIGTNMNGCSQITSMSFQEHPVSWYDALKTCRSKKETLASYEQLLSSNFHDNERFRKLNGVWTGNVSMFTPVLSIVGCFKTRETIISCRSCVSVPLCYSFCHRHNYFGISATNCFCFNKEAFNLQHPRMNASFCVAGNGNGPLNGFTIVYGKNKTNEVGNASSNNYEVFFCIYGSLLGKYNIEKMSIPDRENNSFYPVCNSEDGMVNIISQPEKNWEAANRLCAVKHFGFLLNNVSENECPKEKWTKGGKFWSGQRSYKSAVSLKELKKTGMLVEEISNMRCKTAQGPNLTITTVSCLTEKHPFFCVREDDDESINDVIILPVALVFMVILTIVIIFGLYKWNKRSRLSPRGCDVNSVDNEIPFGLNAEFENESWREENVGNHSPSNYTPSGQSITYDHTPTFLRTNV